MLVFGLAGCELINSPMPPATGPFHSPAGVTLEVVVSGANFPVAMAFLPDGTLLYTEKNTGRIRVVTPEGRLQRAPFADLDVANPGDEGLLGITLDPDFEDNGFVYVALTTNSFPGDNVFPRTALSVVRMTANGRDALDASHTTILDVTEEGGPGHEGGNLHFGPDGMLYLTIGDRGINGMPNFDAQRERDVEGRILRMHSDGSIPSDNPLGPDNRTFAYGMRNSFDFTFDPLSGLLFAAENGPTGDDELNLIEPGMNYGWPRVSGLADSEDEAAFADETPNYRDPLRLVGRAPTGIAFNPGDAYGAELRNDLFLAEYVEGNVQRVRLSEDRRSVESISLFAGGIAGGINDLEFGPDGLIYLTTIDAILRLVPAASP